MVAQVLANENLSPVKNFNLMPFRTKYEVDKKVMEQIKETSPEYYLKILAACIDVTDAKPKLEVIQNEII